MKKIKAGRNVFLLVSLFAIGIILLAITFSFLKGNLSGSRSGIDEIEPLLHMGDSLRTRKPDSSLFYFNTVINRLEVNQKGTEENHFLALAYSGLAFTNSEMGDYQLALKNDSIAINLATRINDRSVLAKSYLVLGLTNFRLGNYDSAFSCYQQSIDRAIAIGDSFTEAKVYANRGQIYTNQGDYNKAKECFLTALSIGQHTNNNQLIAGNFLNLGVLYSDKSESDKRSATLLITTKGSELVASIFPEHSSRINGFLSGLSTEEKEVVRAMLRKLNKSLR